MHSVGLTPENPDTCRAALPWGKGYQVGDVERTSTSRLISGNVLVAIAISERKPTTHTVTSLHPFLHYETVTDVGLVIPPQYTYAFTFMRSGTRVGSLKLWNHNAS